MYGLLMSDGSHHACHKYEIAPKKVTLYKTTFTTSKTISNKEKPLNKRINDKINREHGADVLPAQEPERVEDRHSIHCLVEEGPLLLLRKLDGGRDASPVQSKPRQVVDERAQL
jgi:hypothetical protein